MSRYRSAPPLVVEEWKNEIGQTIQPGDDIIIVTTCTGSTAIKRGIYRGTKNKNVSATAIEQRHTGYCDPATSQVYDNSEFSTLAQAHTGPAPKWPNNYSQETYNAYRSEYDEWYKRYNAFYKLFEPVFEDAPRNTVLQLNRIYKIDTSVFDLKL